MNTPAREQTLGVVFFRLNSHTQAGENKKTGMA